MNKAFVFDFDDTLATTKCSVLVRLLDRDEIVDTLTPSEYNSYYLADDCYFDYSQFACEHMISEGSITFMMSLAKEVHAEDQDVYVLTARSNACADAIGSFMELHGVKPKLVFCVGDNNGKIEQEKRKILLTLLEGYDKLYFYDDHQGNIDSAPDSPKIRKYVV